MKTQTKQMLVRRLAALEAPHKPLRQHEWGSSGAIYEARRTAGVQFWGEGGDGRHRKADQRCRDEAMAVGALRGDSLTSEGKRLARGWCWPFTHSDLRRGLQRLVDATLAGHCMGDRWVPETLLAGADWGQQVASLQWLYIPLLADSVLGSASLINGRAYYRIANVETFEAMALSENLYEDEFDSELSALYDQEFLRCRKAIVADSTRYQDIGFIPLVCKSLESGRSAHDLTGIEPLFESTTTNG